MRPARTPSDLNSGCTEGLPAVHRGKYLLNGATDEDAAKAFAERLQGEAPADSEAKVEGTWQAAYGERHPIPSRSSAGSAVVVTPLHLALQ